MRATVVTAWRDDTARMPSLAHDFWIRTSWALSAPGGLKMPSGALRMPSDASGHADEALGLVVVGRHVLIADRPVESQAVGRLRFEVVVRHPERDPSVVVRAAAQDPGSEPREITARRDGVGLAFELCAAVGRAVGEPGRTTGVGLSARTRAAMRNLVRPHVLLQIGHVQHRARLEQEHRDAEVGQDLGGCAATRTRADHHDVVDRRIRCHLGHESLRLLSRSPAVR